MKDSHLITLAAEMEKIAGYTYGDRERSVFQLMGKHIEKLSQKYPPIDSCPEKQKFLKKFEKLAYSNVSKGYRSLCVYHDEVAELEKKLDNVIRQYWSNDESGCLNLGNTIRFDTYYHGFLLSYKSTLDYLAGGISAGYQKNCTSFRELPKKINLKDELSIKLLEIINNYIPQFNFAVTGESTSLRDEVAHHEFIKSHHIVACSEGLKLVDGRERNEKPAVGVRLSNILLERKNLLINFLDELFSTIEKTDWPYSKQ